jgi:hypothetical protein
MLLIQLLGCSPGREDELILICTSIIFLQFSLLRYFSFIFPIMVFFLSVFIIDYPSSAHRDIQSSQLSDSANRVSRRPGIG